MHTFGSGWDSQQAAPQKFVAQNDIFFFALKHNEFRVQTDL